MNLRHPNIEIPEDDPFLNCKLERKKYAEILLDVVKSSDGFVLAINNEWGTGKTTFIKMWRQLLVNESFRTIYFNAWENDFETTPLPAILAELKSIQKNNNSIKFNSVLIAGAKVAQNVVPAIAKAFLKSYVDKDVLTEGVGGVAKAATELLSDEIKKYTARQKGMLEFRKNLEEYVLGGDIDKPLIFIIDELDRCRPSYAVEFLEHIKHFFSVRGIVFVLAIDKNQLCCSVKGAYGNEGFDSENYLRRFIDVEYSLPKPPNSTFCNFLFGYYGFDDYFNNPSSGRNTRLQAEAANFLQFSSLFFEKANMTLRQQEKVFSHLRISLKSFNQTYLVFPSAYILLTYLYGYNKSLYNKIRNRQLSLQEFVGEIESILNPCISVTNKKFIVYTDALLIFLYANYYIELHQHTSLYIRDDKSQSLKLLVKSLYDSVEDQDLLNRLIAFESSDFYDQRIDYLLNKVELLEPLN